MWTGVVVVTSGRGLHMVDHVVEECGSGSRLLCGCRIVWICNEVEDVEVCCCSR
jgi:hypothetical protein